MKWDTEPQLGGQCQVSGALLEQKEEVAPGAGVKRSRHTKRHLKIWQVTLEKVRVGNSALDPEFSKKVLAVCTN